ncbi:cysteine hydrolase [Leptospira yasudae]|uniref:isochorismatase family cysteine hydrolase n=1 Tax=Leptospira yasudae TaxID=2202201 RepID=UPI001C4E9932|nr:isochorismatase family cysteine hydrolase [Leptospira yasudae]MBW0433968.1 cysteine hydrolase [Leptospira yasudae]
MKNALIVIDFQKDFTSDHCFYAQRHARRNKIYEAKTNLRSLLKSRPNADLLIVASNYKKNQFHETDSMCIPNTKGHELDFEFSDQMQIFYKEDHSIFTNQKLIAELKKENYDSLFLTGFLAEYCVYKSAGDCVMANFNTYIIPECIGTADEKYEKSIQKIQELGVKSISLAEFQMSFIKSNP